MTFLEALGQIEMLEAICHCIFIGIGGCIVLILVHGLVKKWRDR